MDAALESLRRVSGAKNVVLSDCNGVELSRTGDSIESLELFSAVFQNARDTMSRIHEINLVITEYDEFYLVQRGYGEVHCSL